MTDVAPQPASLLDWATGLVTDPAARAGFAADPRGTLDRQGLADLDPADLHHAMSLVTDTVAARVDTVVDAPPTTTAVLDGESRVDALVRQFTSLSEAVTPPDDVPHPWSDTEVDDLDGPSPAAGDHDLDDQVPHDPFPVDHAGHGDALDHAIDHGLDAMTRPESHAPVATVSFLSSAPQRSAAPPTSEGAPDSADGLQDHEGDGDQDPGHHEPEQHEDHGGLDHEHHDLGHHEVEQHHDLDVHDLDAAP